MATDRANVYFQQLEQFNQKANPQPTSENVQIQKVAAPTDNATLTDSGVTATRSTRPFTYGTAKYGQAEYGSYWVWVSGVLVTQGPTV